MRVASILVFLFVLPACASQAVRCDESLQPINAHGASPAGASATAPRDHVLPRSAP
jgi:hypothetical protein